MKIKAFTLTLLVAAGMGSSYALAGNGHGKDQPTTNAATTVAPDSSKKVTLCHKAGKSGRWVKITVSKKALNAHLKRGDVPADAQTTCGAPATVAAVATTTTTTTTTTEATP